MDKNSASRTIEALSRSVLTFIRWPSAENRSAMRARLSAATAAIAALDDQYLDSPLKDRLNGVLAHYDGLSSTITFAGSGELKYESSLVRRFSIAGKKDVRKRALSGVSREKRRDGASISSKATPTVGGGRFTVFCAADLIRDLEACVSRVEVQIDQAISEHKHKVKTDIKKDAMEYADSVLVMAGLLLANGEQAAHFNLSLALSVGYRGSQSRKRRRVTVRTEDIQV